MARRSKARLEDMIDQRWFGNEEVVAALNEMDFPDLVGTLQAPETITETAPGHGYWTEGDGRPALADERPEVMAALARCALNRSRMAETGVIWSTFHAERCGWCDYPLPRLLEALDWWAFHARYIVAEWWVWRQGTDPIARQIVYRRATGRAGTYEEPKAATFAALPLAEQRKAVDEVQRTSKPDAPVEREHEPWCRYEPDHPGDCSTRPAEEEPDGPKPKATRR